MNKIINKSAVNKVYFICLVSLVNEGSSSFGHVIAFTPSSGFLVCAFGLDPEGAIFLIEHEELFPASFELLAALNEQFSKFVVFPL